MQAVQSIVDGGRDTQTRYGGNLDYLANFDLMRMGVFDGALIKFRAESRYGKSVNGACGAHPARQHRCVLPADRRPR